MSHKAQILAHLQKGLPITPLDALNLFGCFRLGARIWDLRHDGWNIKKTTKETTGRDGRITRFAEYRLIEGGEICT